MCLIQIPVGEIIIRPVKLRIFKALTGAVGSAADIAVPAQASPQDKHIRGQFFKQIIALFQEGTINGQSQSVHTKQYIMLRINSQIKITIK